MTGGHPDPDHLVTLAAGQISGRDRENLLRHMSGCEACRECLFAMTESAQPAEAHQYAFATWIPTLAISTALAAAACWFISYSWPPKMKHQLAAVSEQTGNSKGTFENVTLTSASKLRPMPRPWVLVRFFNGRPQLNQIVLRTSHGERLITLAMPSK